MYKFYLNNTLVTEPRGWDVMSTSIVRDRTLKAVLVSQDLSVEFTNETEDNTLIPRGYDFLNDIFEASGFTDEVSVLILIQDGGNFVEFYKGIIFIADIEFDRYQKIAKVKIRDNAYDARINNNKSIKVFPTADSSKNNESITAASIGTMDWFRVSTGGVIQDDAVSNAIVYCYRVYDVFRQLIAYISDGTVEFRSSAFEGGGEFENLLITTGRAFRKSVLSAFTVNTNDFEQKWPGISLDDLLHDLTRIADFNFIIENGTVPVFRFERDSYFNSQGVIYSITDLEELKDRVEVSMLFSKLKLGSGKVKDLAFLSFAESTKLIGWNQEEYPILGTSNIDNTLDLSLRYITSSNVIEYIYENAIPNTDEELDNEFIFVTADYVSTNTYTPTKTNWIDSSSIRFYNENLTNDHICSRFLGGVPNSISNNIAPATSSFQAYVRNLAADLTTIVVPWSTPTDINPVKFGGVNYDINGDYVASPTYEFIAPVNAAYTFGATIYCGASLGNAAYPYMRMSYTASFMRYDSGGTLIYQYDYEQATQLNNVFDIPANSVKNRIVAGSRRFTCNAGDRIRVKMSVVHYNAYVIGGLPGFFILHDSFFELIEMSTSGGVFKPYDPNNYPVIRSEFEAPVTFSEWQTILANPRGRVQYSRFGDHPKYGRIESVKMDHNKGIAKFVLNSSKKPN